MPKETAAGLESSLSETIRHRLGGDAAVTLIPFRNPAPTLAKCERYILTATGDAHTGAVRAITELVAERGGNFVDFAFENSDTGVSFMAEIDLPADAAIGALQIDLAAAAAKDDNLRVRLQHQRLFTATNDIAFRRVGA